METRIRELRLEKGLRQRDVAERLGISAQSLGYYENWVNKPDPETLIKLADFFEVSIDYLLCREDEYGVIATNRDPQFTAEERELIKEYRRLPDEVKAFICNAVKNHKNS